MKLKLPAGVTQEFVDSIQNMKTDELKSLIVQLQVQNQENEEFTQTDEYQASEETFKQAKDEHDLIAGPVRETRISLKNRTRAVVERLKDKGGA